MRFSSKGMEPDPCKIEALKNAKPPANVSELKSFLGMTNYSSQFIRNYSDRTAKIRELLSRNNKWNWTDDHQKCCNELKNSLHGENVLGCFDIKTNTKVIVDASFRRTRSYACAITKVGA